MFFNSECIEIMNISYNIRIIYVLVFNNNVFNTFEYIENMSRFYI